jgi:hypothetical protein
MFHIKSVIPKVINKINLKEDPSEEAPHNKGDEVIKKNTPDKEVFLGSRKKKLINKRR